MSFPAYPKYRDSGIEWLRDVPDEWGSTRLRWLSCRYSGGTPDKRNLDYWQNGIVPWLNSGAVNDRFILKPSTYITTEAFENSSAKWIPKGALVMALAGQGKTKGMVAQLGIRTTCNQSMAAIVPATEISTRFLFWWLESNYQNIRNMAGGDLRDGLNLGLLGNVPCPLPDSTEQRAIASFLDSETSKIDALVAEQRRLIELLKEKRQAVISHAVTKGLNPNAKMKDSGIEWLGDVPEHWEPLTLRRCSLFIQTGGTPSSKTPSADIEDGVLWYTPGDFGETLTLTDSARKISPGTIADGDSRLFPAGSVLIVSIGATLGKVGYSAKPCSSNQQINAVIPNHLLDGYFLSYSLSVKADVMRCLSNSSTIGIMNQEKTKKICVTVPPLPEQRAIASFLDSETSKIDALVAEAKKATALLQERRTALISAAVTGKIDVRNSKEAAA